jgi:hypothetical protein
MRIALLLLPLTPLACRGHAPTEPPEGGPDVTAAPPPGMSDEVNERRHSLFEALLDRFNAAGTINDRPPGWFQYCPDGLAAVGDPPGKCREYWNVAGEPGDRDAMNPLAPPSPAADLVTWLLWHDADFTGAGSESESFEDVIPQYQVYADRFAWQNFIALNWPADADGAPLTDAVIGERPDAPRVVDAWMNANQLFAPGGAAPPPWGTPEPLPEACGPAPEGPVLVFETDGDEQLLRSVVDLRGALEGPRAERFAESEVHVKGPLVDQNRQWVRYVSAVNQRYYDYIVENTLYSAAGQEAFYRSGDRVSFPDNTRPPPDLSPRVCQQAVDDCVAAAAGADVTCDQTLYRRCDGSVEVKFSWKIMGEGDDPSRFHTRRAWFVETGPGTQTCEEAEVGLVGLHIMHKSRFAPKYLWSTFEHVDNACETDGTGADRPSFCDPGCPPEECPPNVEPPQLYPGTPAPWGVAPMPGEAGEVAPSQVERFRRLPQSTRARNAELQAALAAAEGSVWQYYELVNAQWVMHTLTQQVHIEGYRGDGEVFAVIPPYLVNTTIETYEQVDGTCAGCHSLARMAIGGEGCDCAPEDGACQEACDALGTDFSWLLNTAQ